MADFEKRQRSEVFEFTNEAIEGKILLAQNYKAGTGGVTWPVALCVARYMCQNPCLVKGKVVVEVGAGTGMLGMVAAKLGAKRVVLTDCEVVIPILNRTVQLNYGSVEGAAKGETDNGCVVEVRPLLWGKKEDLDWFVDGSVRADVCVGVDIVFFMEQKMLRQLAFSFRKLLGVSSGSEKGALVQEGESEKAEVALDKVNVVVGYESRGSVMTDIEFFQAMRDMGFERPTTVEMGDLADKKTPSDELAMYLFTDAGGEEVFKGDEDGEITGNKQWGLGWNDGDSADY